MAPDLLEKLFSTGHLCFGFWKSVCNLPAPWWRQVAQEESCEDER